MKMVLTTRTTIGLQNKGCKIANRGDATSTAEKLDATGRCVYRKLKRGRNDGEAHRGSGVNE
jgi:hypothetical protein